MRPISLRSGRNRLRFSWMSAFFMWFSTIAMMKATICPITVAMAAPFAPMFSVKMKMGSSMRLMIAPRPCVNIV